MLVIVIRGRNVIVPTELCSFVLAVVVYNSGKFLFNRARKWRRALKMKKSSALRIFDFALYETRGGAGFFEDSVLNTINSVGYYEIVGWRLTSIMEHLLRSNGSKTYYIVTPAFLRAVEHYAFSVHPPVTVNYKEYIYFYRVRLMLVQAAGWVTSFFITDYFRREWVTSAYGIALLGLILIHPLYTIKEVEKLPNAHKNIQYIERVAMKEPRVIMQVGSPPPLLELIPREISDSTIIDVDENPNLMNIQNAESRSSYLVNDNLLGPESDEKNGTTVKKAIAVLKEKNSSNYSVTNKKSYLPPKVKPLSERTRTLSDLKVGINEKSAGIGETFQNRVNYSLGIKVSNNYLKGSVSGASH